MTFGSNLWVLRGLNSSEPCEQTKDSTKPTGKREFPVDSSKGATAGMYKERKNRTDEWIMINFPQKGITLSLEELRQNYYRYVSRFNTVERFPFWKTCVEFQVRVLFTYQPQDSTDWYWLSYLCNYSIKHECAIAPPSTFLLTKNFEKGKTLRSSQDIPATRNMQRLD